MCCEPLNYFLFSQRVQTRKKKRKQKLKEEKDANLISETVQTSTVQLKGICIMRVTLAFAFLKKFDPCFF